MPIIEAFFLHRYRNQLRIYPSITSKGVHPGGMGGGCISPLFFEEE